MLQNAVQEHEERDPATGAIINTTSSRLLGTGYPLSAGGESVYAYAKSPLEGHASFEVDWGQEMAVSSVRPDIVTATTKERFRNWESGWCMEPVPA